MKHLVYPRLSLSYSNLLWPSDWRCTFQLQSHGKIWVRDYSFPNTRDLTDFIITIIKPSNINFYILISFSRQFLISRNPHTLVLFISVKKSREAKINKSTDFLIGFYFYKKWTPIFPRTQASINLIGKWSPRLKPPVEVLSLARVPMRNGSKWWLTLLNTYL